MLYVRHVHLTKVKHIHKKQTYHLVRTMSVRVQLEKISGRDPQGAWHQGELTGGNPSVAM
jgi:hypothetical protein